MESASPAHSNALSPCSFEAWRKFIRFYRHLKNVPFRKGPMPVIVRLKTHVLPIGTG